MRPVRALAQVAFCLSTMGSLAAAWPTWMEEMHLIARQDDDEADAPRETQTSSTRRGPLNTAAEIDPDAPRPTPTGRAGGGSSSNSTKTKDREEFDAREPAGKAVMVTPDPRLGVPLYKAGDFVTWVWNYTNLLATPTAIDVILSCSEARATWTLAGNETFQSPHTFTWDSRVQKTDPVERLLTEEYTLIIKDSDAELTASPEPGYLSRSDIIIDIYLPKDPTPLSEFECATCSGAPPELNQRALAFASSMALITIFSFTWFVAGLGL